MTRRKPTALRLPSTDGIFWAPERAILAALDASLVIAIRALAAAHPALDDPDEPTDEPLLWHAHSILATAAGLHELIAGYDGLAEHLSRLPAGPAPAPSRPPPSSPKARTQPPTDGDDPVPF